eukprot:GHVP01016223.1.p1 GENE.GHVP01016223.1~~GHVP01016223.1.p1  ORF type:complete len:1937 (-),score=348.64 GHVP01016223.1:5686-11496(-)
MNLMNIKHNKIIGLIFIAFSITGLLLTMLIRFIKTKEFLIAKCHDNGVYYKGKCYCDPGYKGNSCFSKHRNTEVIKDTILFITDSFEENIVIGGRVLLAKKLSFEKKEVTVLVTSPSPSFKKLKKEMKRQNISLLRLSKMDIFSEGKHENKSLMVYEFLKQNKTYETVIFFESTGLGYYTLIARKQGLLSIDSKLLAIHDSIPKIKMEKELGIKINNKESQKIDYMTKITMELADKVISPNKVLADRLIQYGWDIAEDNLLTAPYPILRVYGSGNNPIERVNDSFPKRQRNITELVFIGKLSVEDGLDTFLDAIDYIVKKDLKQKHKILKKRVLRIHFFGQNTMVSPETEMTGKEFIEQRSLQWGKRSRVTISTNISIRKVISYMTEKGRSRVAVVPSKIDTSGFIFLQLIAAGANVITSAIRTHKDALHIQDRKETVFTKNDSFALSKKLIDTFTIGGISPRPLNNTQKEIYKWNDVLSSTITKRDIPKLENPLVTIVITHHNRSKLLEQAVESIEKQDYKNIEVIVVDDGSTDKTSVEYIAKLGWRFWQERKWRVIRGPNRYVGSARNTGVTHANGEYILFLDDDNIAKKNLISTMILSAELTGSEIITTGYDIFSGNRNPNSKSSVGRKIYLGGDSTVGVQENCFGSSTMLVSKSFFSRTGGFTEDYGIGFEDYEFLAKSCLNGAKIETIPEALFWHRRHRDVVSQQTDYKANHIRVLRAYSEIVNYLHSSLQEIVKLEQQKHLQKLVATTFSQQLTPRANASFGDFEEGLDTRDLTDKVEDIEQKEEEVNHQVEQEEEVFRKDSNIKTNAKEKNPNYLYKLNIPSQQVKRKDEDIELSDDKEVEKDGKSCISVDSAAYTGRTGELDVRLVSPVNSYKKDPILCNKILDFYEGSHGGFIKKLGIKNCNAHFLSPQVMKINISPEEFPIKPLKFSFKGSNILDASEQKSSDTNCDCPIIEIDNGMSPGCPFVSVNTTPLVGRNNAIIMDLSRSITNAGGYFAKAEFDVSTNAGDKSSPLKSYLEDAASKFIRDELMIFTIPSNLADSFTKYTFQFTLTNILGKSETATILVQKIDKIIPCIFIDGPRRVFLGDIAIFQAFLSDCSLEKGSSLQYIWKIITEKGNKDAKIKDGTNSTFLIERGSLPTGKYILTLKLFYTEPSYKESQTYYYSHPFAILSAPFVARILGGSRAFIKEDIEVVSSIIKRSVYDVQFPEEIIQQWKFSTGDADFDSVTPLRVFAPHGEEGELVDEMIGPTVYISLKDLHPGVYVLHLKATVKDGEYSSEDKVTINLTTADTGEIAINLTNHPPYIFSSDNEVTIIGEVKEKSLNECVWKWEFIRDDGPMFYGYMGDTFTETTNDGRSSFRIDAKNLVLNTKYSIQGSVKCGSYHGRSRLVIEKHSNITNGSCRIRIPTQKTNAFSKFRGTCSGWGNDILGGVIKYKFLKITDDLELPFAPGSPRPVIDLVLEHGKHEIVAEIYDHKGDPERKKVGNVDLKKGNTILSSYFMENVELFKRSRNLNLGYELLSLIAPLIHTQKVKKSFSNPMAQEAFQKSEEITTSTMTESLKLIESISSLSRVDSVETGPYLLQYLHTILPEKLSVDQRGHVVKALAQISSGMSSDTKNSKKCYSQKHAEAILTAMDPVFKNPRDGTFIGFLVDNIKEEMLQCYKKELSSGSSMTLNSEEATFEIGKFGSNEENRKVGVFRLKDPKGSNFIETAYRYFTSKSNLMQIKDHSLGKKVVEFRIDSENQVKPQERDNKYKNITGKGNFKERVDSSLPNGSVLTFSYALDEEASNHINNGKIPKCIRYVRGEKVNVSGWTSDNCKTLDFSKSHVLCQSKNTGEFTVIFQRVVDRKITLKVLISIASVVIVVLIIIACLLIYRKSLNRHNRKCPDGSPTEKFINNVENEEKNTQGGASTSSDVSKSCSDFSQNE